MKDYYSVLGISKNATDEEVKKAYRELSKKYHPDKHQNNDLMELAEIKFKEVNEAYQAITSERKNKNQERQDSYKSSHNDQKSYNTQFEKYIDSALNYFSLGNMNKAIEFCNLAIKENSKSAEGYYVRAMIYASIPNLEEAMKSISVAISKGNLDFEHLIDFFKKLIEIETKESIAYSIEILIHCSVKFKNLISRSAKSDLYKNLADLYSILGNKKLNNYYLNKAKNT